MRRVEPRRRAVIAHDAILAQHDAVAAAARLQRVPAVDVDAIEQRGNVASLQLDLAERGNVNNADVFADIARLAICRFVLGFAGARIRVRPFPETCVDKTRTLLFMPRMHRRVPRGFDVLTLRMPGECAERYRRIRRAERRRADLRN